jgi:cation diffusion facilitator family transporter
VCISPDIPTDKLITTIPFVKAHEFDYSWLSPFKGQLGVYCSWGIYMIMIIVVILACSNGVNLTDGLDGLSAGTSSLVAVVIGLLAYLSGSLAVMGDGIDSTSDVLIAIVTLVISGIISRPGDREHPWGHARAETTATMVLSFVIFYAGAQLVAKSAGQLFHQDFTREVSVLAISATIVSIIGKSLLAVLEYHYGTIADSDIVRANAMNMKNDIIMSAAVMLGLVASHFLKCPILDPIIALLVGLWVIKNAVSLFTQINTELMDGNTDNALYRKLHCHIIDTQAYNSKNQ